MALRGRVRDAWERRVGGDGWREMGAEPAVVSRSGCPGPWWGHGALFEAEMRGLSCVGFATVARGRAVCNAIRCIGEGKGGVYRNKVYRYICLELLLRCLAPVAIDRYTPAATNLMREGGGGTGLGRAVVRPGMQSPAKQGGLLPFL